MALFGISIGVILGLALLNYFNTLNGYLLCSPIDLEFDTLIGTLIVLLLVNYLAVHLDNFLVTWNGSPVGTHLGATFE